MKILITLANPNKQSFCKAIAETAAKTLEKKGCLVIFHDLYKEKFLPVLPKGEDKRTAKLPAIIKEHCKEIREADGIIIVHPNWWGMPPAILKGWIDRVIRVGVAYKFLEGDKGDGVPVGLLKAKTAIVFNTSNTKPAREKKTFKDPLETIWKNCVFGLCGVKDFYRKTYGVIVTSTLRQRKSWLKDVERIVNMKFRS
jgi:putative NADPH-quinone reductase